MSLMVAPSPAYAGVAVHELDQELGVVFCSDPWAEHAHPDSHDGSNVAGNVAPPLRVETMETTRKREARRRRHVQALQARSLREAGTLERVGNAIGRKKGTVAHYVTDKEFPVLRDAFNILTNLNGYPGVSGRAFAEAVNEAIELSDIVLAADETLIERGLHLLGQKARLVTAVIENDSTDTLRKLGSVVLELAAITDELAMPERGPIDLRALFRERGGAT